MFIPLLFKDSISFENSNQIILRGSPQCIAQVCYGRSINNQQLTNYCTPRTSMEGNLLFLRRRYDIKRLALDRTGRYRRDSSDTESIETLESSPMFWLQSVMNLKLRNMWRCLSDLTLFWVNSSSTKVWYEFEYVGGLSLYQLVWRNAEVVGW